MSNAVARALFAVTLCCSTHTVVLAQLSMKHPNAAKQTDTLTPDEQKRLAAKINSLTPKQRKQLAKAMKKMTPAEQNQVAATLKSQLARSR
jgi:uncharacterized membrane protein YgcG